ncbi:MAG: PaaI family thioesterase [Clostridiales bacterium]|nr:PaaI family thioesterase [Clostridiales bacterium]
MTELISGEELRRRAVEFIAQRAQSPARAWPRFGKDIALVDEDGPAGSLLFACRTDESMSNPMGIVHGGITASLVDTCMGVTCTAQCGGVPTPTVTMTVNYARPVPLNADILVRTRTIRVGNTSGQMQAEVFLAGAPEEALVTSSGVYAIKR